LFLHTLTSLILTETKLHVTYQIRRVWRRARAIAHYSCPGLSYILNNIQNIMMSLLKLVPCQYFFKCLV